MYRQPFSAIVCSAYRNPAMLSSRQNRRLQVRLPLGAI
jgi:hypothetical protein